MEFEYVSYIILGIIFGITIIVIIQTKKYYYEIAEKDLAERMKKRLYDIQNNVESEDVKYMKHVMKDLDKLTKETKRKSQPDTTTPSLTPTSFVSQINATVNVGISKIHELFMDLYDEYIKPVIYKTTKMIS